MKSIAVVFAIALALTLMVCGVYAQGDASSKDVEFSVIAEGSAAVEGGDLGKAEDEAQNAAKRNAVEQGVGVFVKAETIGEDYEVVKQTIITRSEGYIASWSIVEGSRKVEDIEGSKLLTIKISAKIRLISLLDDLSDISEIYEAIQRPRVMVLISETNMDRASDGLGTAAQAVMRILQDRKFDVVDPDTVKQLIAEEANRAAIERGDAKAAALLAMKKGAEILVLGNAKTFEQKLPEGAGDDLKSVSAQVSARIVYSDTGDVLYTAKPSQAPAVATSTAEEAGLKALNKAGEQLIKNDSDRFADQVIARWAMELQKGRRMRVIASGVSFSDVTGLKKVIQGFRGFVKFVGSSALTGNTATIEFLTKLTPDEVNERLDGAKVGAKRVDITGTERSVTRVTVKK